MPGMIPKQNLLRPCSFQYFAAPEQLWLQTSEGVGPMPKLQVVAEPLSQEPADHDEAHPVAKPVNCG